jgi:hypothetical protein
MLKTARYSWSTFFFCTLTGGLIIFDTLRYPEVQGQGFGQGPAFYPRLLAGVLIFLGCLTLGQGFYIGKKKNGEAISTDTPISYTPVILLNVVCILLVGLMEYIGFFVSGFLLIFLNTCIIRQSWIFRHVIEGLVFSFGMVFLIYLVFELFVGIQLPQATFFK